jgi:hypothetical protein
VPEGARRAFALAVAGVLAAALLFSWRSSVEPPALPAPVAANPAPERERRGEEATRALVYESQNPRAPTREPEQTSPRRRLEVEGTRVARAFLADYLPYEVGRSTAAGRRRIVALATPELGVELAEGEPRAPAATRPPDRARVLALEGVYGPRQRRSMTAAATLEREGERSTLLITLARREGKWRVYELGR